MYHFVDLTDAQKHERRHLLDSYAAIAQLSVVVPLVAIQGVFLIQRLYKNSIQGSYFANGAIPISQQDPRGDSPGSPYAKHDESNGRAARRLAISWRRFAWWCGEEVAWAECTRGEAFGAAVWGAWLLLLCFLQTGDDYLHLTKRFGLVAASQLPLHYLLSTKTPYSPLQYLTRTSHETLISIHQLLGRIIILLFAIHVALYTNFFVVSSLLATKLTQAYIIAGYFAFLSLAVLGTTAMSWVRRKNYRMFHAIHVILSLLVLPALWVHVSHIRIYLYETLAIYVLNQLLRSFATKVYEAHVSHIPGTRNLVSVTFFSREIRSKLKYPLGGWQPGHHAYLSTKPAALIWPWSRGNPLTLACVPSHPQNAHENREEVERRGTKLMFVARVLNGQTKSLLDHQGHSDLQRPVAIEGPYGISGHADRLLSYDRVLFVAGGIGGTFCVPLYMQLLADLSPSVGSHRRGKVAFLWVVKSLTEIGWAIPEDAREQTDFVERLRVCVTGSLEREDEFGYRARGGDGKSGKRRSTRKSGRESQPGGDNADSHDAVVENGEEGIELEERKNLLAGVEAPTPNEHSSSSRRPRSMTTTILKTPGLTVHSGRPELARAVNQVFSQSASERVAVVVCGPRGLGATLRTEVGRHVRRGRDVWFWDERFAL